ncbi:MAG: GNAT family N-acetyltransferase [Vibrio sp.]
MTITCQILTTDHIPAYRVLRLESLRLHPECFGANYEAERQKEVLFFEEQIASQTDTLMIGAFDDHQLLGMCGLIAIDDEKYLLVGMYVQSTYRGLGASTQLVQYAQTVLAESIRTAIVLTVYEENQVALAFYKRVGFSHQSTLGNEILMQWDDANHPH